MHNAEKSYNGYKVIVVEIEKDVQKVIKFDKKPIVEISYYALKRLIKNDWKTGFKKNSN